MTGESAIQLHDVEKRYGSRTVLRGLGLDVPRGTVCALVGPNGAGKTTTIKMLLGLAAPTSGRVRVVGLDPIKQGDAVRQRIGYVPERHHIYEWMTVGEVLRFASELYERWDQRECDRVDDILQLPRDRKVKLLSRGELAKLALLVALAPKPELLILDEPTSGLDPFVRRQVLDAIINLLESGDRSILFSTHILSDVERVADRVVVLSEGAIAADMSLERARSTYVRARFTFAESPPPWAAPAGVVRLERGEREWIAVIDTRVVLDPRAIGQELGAHNSVLEPVSFEDAVIELSTPRRSECSRS